MKITFELKGEQEIKIIAEENGKKHQVGQIFAPSANSLNSTNVGNQNAIQVCGFSKAYYLWGCGVFGKPSCKGVELEKLTAQYDRLGKKLNPLAELFSGDTKSRKLQSRLLDKRATLLKEMTNYEQAKDIQLEFEFETELHKTKIEGFAEDCHYCYNVPCTCKGKKYEVE